MSIELNTFENLELFKERERSFLYNKEIINGLMIGLLERLEHDLEINYMAEIVKDGEPIVVILQTHPKQAIFAYADEIKSKDLKEAARLIVNDYPELPGVIGERDITLELGAYIARLRDRDSVIAMKQRIYRLDQVEQPADFSGATFKKVSMEDNDLVADFICDFFIVAGEEINKEEALKKAKQNIESGYLYGWYVDDKLVSICNSSRKTKTARTVSLVYTPKEERKKGYASNQVAAFSQLLLDEGNQTCVLYTDLKNKTSNKIYQAIGYKPVCDSILIHLK
ncbi:GNAT family N-acetyltransferase [Haloplasma contractile]|uniref:Acetyltransferase protein n=1 Tax=Haloplasma contractile SSD-17B TaxID=1033810 RepID=F7PUA8_9MOLU|nr:GNAT family N-acetyltransferase [Haloplasma contractile]ERJ11706.1 Acetyltransferase protein [Haloplasma contractile SSD-17B]